ncbi:eb73cdf7-c27d-414d-aa07-1a101b714155 [Thermothielavioides terrestris]|uniref:Eb73cdf7-c27d-414d-aa07-1a101b714155 n=1 Tax=Thermothielavioides terrestris TaxID=2587410 RepID=A0A3S4ALR8_9PEZI|nr:eb73cdf7-c27d-414d-aa07-1a101b714155 [Thermothielavioides terrestris]
MHLLLLSLVSLLPLSQAAPQATLGNLDFPDPSITYDPQTRAWYAFATQGNGHHVQAAKAASPSGPWTYLSNTDLLPTPPSWASTPDPAIWAPDVHYLRATDSFVLYFAALQPAAAGGRHCVGAATARNITGPFAPLATPLACPVAEGGAIDPAGFEDDADGSRWVLYKVDGNAAGPGGPCGNGDAPGRPTPIRLQRVDSRDGVTVVGEPVTLLDRDAAEDGPLVEAPSLVKLGPGRFALCYSSHCFNTADYDVRYATAESIQGPYTRRGQLIGKQAGAFGLVAPGGATGIAGGGGLVFHANCPAGRCMYETEYAVGGDGAISIPAGV